MFNSFFRLTSRAIKSIGLSKMGIKGKMRNVNGEILNRGYLVLNHLTYSILFDTEY